MKARFLFSFLLFLGFSSFYNSASATVRIVVDSVRSHCYPVTAYMHVEVTGDTAKIAICNWKFGDGNVNTNPKQDSSVVHTYLKPSKDTSKDYRPTVTVVLTDGTKYTVTDSTSIVVYDHPTAKISLSGSPSQCLNRNNFCFADSSIPAKNSNGKIVKYYWDLGDGKADSARQFCHSYTSAGRYTVTHIAIDTFGCRNTVFTRVRVMDSSSIKVTRDPRTGAFSIGSDTSLMYITHFVWDFGDGKKDSIHINPVHSYANSGKYQVSINFQTRAGCQQFAADSFSVLASEIGSEPSEAVGCQIFPNPATSNFTIRYSLKQPSDIRFLLTDMLGNTVHLLSRKNADSGELQVDAEALHLSKGVYILSLTDKEGNSYRGQIILQ